MIKMKQTTQRLLIILIAIFLTGGFAIAQAPQAIPYQAAARNSTGTILPNKTIGLRFTVHDASATGTVVYNTTPNYSTAILGKMDTSEYHHNV